MIMCFFDLGGTMYQTDFIDRSLCFRTINDDINTDFSASIIGYEECCKTKPTIDCNKSCYILHFVVKGKGYFSLPHGEKQSIGPGECFLIEPNSHTWYRPDTKTPWAYFWIEINGNIVKKICDQIRFHEAGMHLPITDFDTILTCFSHIFDSNSFIDDQSGEFLRVTGEIMRIFSILLKEQGIQHHDIEMTKEKTQIKKIIDYVNNNYLSPDISVKKIADNFYFSQAYLSRIFKKSMGISPIKYIIMLRMRRAVELLNRKTFSISQIATCVGYKNQFYFSKEFKDYFGVSPSKYTLNPSLLDQHVPDSKK